MVGTSLPADRVHEGGIRPSPLAALGPARLPARRRSVGGKEILPFVEYRFGHARGPWHRVSVDCRYFGQTANPAPPDTTISCPVMYAAPSEARNATVSAMSSGLPTRPNGFFAAVAASIAATSSDPMPGVVRIMGVSVNPGLTALTRMRRGASSRASVGIMVSSAPRDP